MASFFTRWNMSPVAIWSRSGASYPASAMPARGVLGSDGRRAQEDFAQLSDSSSAGRYQLVIESSNLARLLLRFDQDYETLGTRLSDLG